MSKLRAAWSARKVYPWMVERCAENGMGIPQPTFPIFTCKLGAQQTSSLSNPISPASTACSLIKPTNHMWPRSIPQHTGTIAQELFAVISATATFGSGWEGKTINLNSDSREVVLLVNAGMLPRKVPFDPMLVSVFASLARSYKFKMTARWVHGTENKLADALSPSARGTCREGIQVCKSIDKYIPLMRI
ncbi:hypothetical protein BC829DRAFT_403764 [Chytridium lagenaria]|nr:hypothetical protein BC829DRAFT_403764 [Chytridium lagenaria]